MKSKILTIIILLFILSCQNRNNMNYFIGSAISEYEWIKADLSMEQLEFNGPFLKEKIEKFDIDTSKIIFGWNHIHIRDTFWIYVEITKKEKLKSDGVYFSSNFDELRMNWKKWYDK